MTGVHDGVTVLAKSGEGGKAGPIGLAVILLLCIACYFLFKSMSKHLRQVREHFPVDEPVAPPAVRATPGTVRAPGAVGTEHATPPVAPVPKDQLPE
jgi:hypothetical protein